MHIKFRETRLLTGLSNTRRIVLLISADVAVYTVANL